MSESKWAKVNRLYLAKPARVGQESPRRAAATYQQIQDQQEEDKKRYGLDKMKATDAAMSRLREEYMRTE